MKKPIQTLAKASIFSAVVFLMTYFVSVPSITAFGNVNLGDCALLLTSWLLPCRYVFCAVGIGSALADIVSPYAVYAPATFIIKGLMAVVASVIFTRLEKKPLLAQLISGVTAELIMIVGYFAFESIFICGAKTALLNIPFNAVQGSVGLICGILLYTAVGRHFKK